MIVAAGAGSRLGGVAKAMLSTGDTTYLGAIVRTMAKAGVDPSAIVIVVGAPHGDAVAKEAARHALRDAIVWNDDPSRGMASSVAIGFEALDAVAHRAAAGIVSAALLWPVDHPWVRASTIEALDDAFTDHEAVIPTFDQRGGHPALIARALWPKLAACGDHPDGARGVLRAARVRRVPVDDPAILRDVDLPEDLA
ncbi:MAG TPA: nucleotidyltransferase family protein [Kofleriaceae bacterium]|nr:nucleotidyltransferase family protein [Kofleriaceae bacterium]